MVVKVNWLNEWFPSYFPSLPHPPLLPSQPSSCRSGLVWQHRVQIDWCMERIWNEMVEGSKLNRVALKRENFKVSEF
jgi:hypothetical protein